MACLSDNLEYGIKSLKLLVALIRFSSIYGSWIIEKKKKKEKIKQFLEWHNYLEFYCAKNSLISEIWIWRNGKLKQ